MERSQSESVNNTQTSTETPAGDISITLNDLVILRNIVNVASRRGAFTADEFSDIGAVYNKVDGFLKVHLKKMQGEQGDQPVAETTKEDTTENKIEI
tara:strand:- start:152 stop:442 length:291 start_codon:yes stop_codon:yes gene_type:complete